MMKRILLCLFGLLFIGNVLSAQSQCDQYSGRRRDDCLRAARANQGRTNNNNTAREREAARVREEARQRRVAAAREEARREEARRAEARREEARREAARLAARRAARTQQERQNQTRNQQNNTAVNAAQPATPECADKARIENVDVPLETVVGQEACFEATGNGFVTWLIGENGEEKYGNVICHTFPQTGAYTIKVLFDTDCDTQETAKTIAVTASASPNVSAPTIPAANPPHNQQNCTPENEPYITNLNLPAQVFVVGQSYVFKATVATFEIPSRYTWTFGNETIEGEEIRHTFNKAGAFPIKLVVENACGRATNETEPLVVRKNSPVDQMGLIFLPVQAGAFTMGDGQFEDAPPHRVRITESFEVTKHEITQQQWRTVMGTNPSKNTRCGDNCPVENVSFLEVQEYINKLNEMDLTHLYRLPTEAEWELFARAGTNGIWFFGDNPEQICTYANFGSRVDVSTKTLKTTVNCAEASPKIVSVGQYPANAFGIQDVYGNVAEWTQDCYHEFFYLQNTLEENPVNFNCSGAQAIRSIRGGAWNKAGTSTQRFYAPSNSKDGNIGFRLVRVPLE